MPAITVADGVHACRPGTPGDRTAAAWSRPDRDLGARFVAFSTGVIADAMHRLGAMDAGIRPMWSGAALTGSVLTVWVRAGDNARIHEAIALVEPGDVLVIAAQGSLTHAVFGEFMALACLARGVVGVVLDGALRDVAALADLRLPAFARGACAFGPLKEGTGEVGFPLACGGVVCTSGDLVRADSDGVVVVPAGDAETVLRQAELIEQWEIERRKVLAAAVLGPA